MYRDLLHPTWQPFITIFFCLQRLDNSATQENDSNSFENQFPEILRGESGVLIIVLACMVMLLILIGVGLLLIRNRRKAQNKQNRRYPLY